MSATAQTTDQFTEAKDEMVAKMYEAVNVFRTKTTNASEAQEVPFLADLRKPWQFCYIAEVLIGMLKDEVIDAQKFSEYLRDQDKDDDSNRGKPAHSQLIEFLKGDSNV